MRGIAFPSYEYRFSNFSFESITCEFDDLKIISSNKNQICRGIILFSCSEDDFTKIRDKVFPYFLTMEGF